VIKYGAAIAVTAVVAAVCVLSVVRQTADRSGEARHDLPAGPAEFTFLYGQNCAGCHGADGTGGGARGLVDPIFLRIADDAVIRGVVTRGVAQTAMPAFARAAGGPLTDDQIGTIVRGLRSRSGNSARTDDTEPPPYAVSASGDPARGGNAFVTFCSRCHGADGRGGPVASSIVDPAYLSLLSNQSLRTTVIAGRSDLGAPDWRGNVPGRPMSAQEVSDVVAWLAARRMP
jgi:cytochrome c oxidase cbb3-type subunit 3